MQNLTDVIVIGMGAAGCAAAVAAHDSGARVVVLEKTTERESGGNTRVSGGAWFHHDDPGGIATYLRSLAGRRPIPEPVVRTWAEKTREITEWLRVLGINGTPTPAPIGASGPVVSVEYPMLAGSSAYGGYRCVDGKLGNGVLFEALKGLLAQRQIEIRYESRASELLVEGDRVVGVRLVTGEELRAGGGVVLATGGFEANPDLVREHIGFADVPVWGSAAGTGDGLLMAQAVGADLWHLDNMMAVDGIAEPGSQHAHRSMIYRNTGAFLWLDEHGERFMNETAFAGHGQALIDGELVRKPDRPMVVVFDERARLSGPLSPPPEEQAVGWQVLMNGYRWSADNSVEIERGWIERSDTLAELASQVGLPAEHVVASIARYNESCAAGGDQQFGRAAATMEPVQEPPFYAYRSGPAMAWTNGGPRRDEHARVLRSTGEPIPGLYAAGNVSSTYSWAKDGGFHIADALVFGRIAGEGAAERANG